jgi:hypothetical protein
LLGLLKLVLLKILQFFWELYVKDVQAEELLHKFAQSSSFALVLFETLVFGMTAGDQLVFGYTANFVYGAMSSQFVTYLPL